MGAVPKRRISTRRKGKRRLNKKTALPKLISCTHCKQPKISHVQCPNCHK